jgi:hypothetical protein
MIPVFYVMIQGLIERSGGRKEVGEGTST